MKIIAIIQARMSSSRFPGKVLEKINGYPYSIVELIVERLKKVDKIDKVIIATSDQPEDDMLADEIERLGESVVRGSLNNVYARFIDVIVEYPCDHVVRITADCPLLSPALIAQMIDTHLIENNDYTSTALVPTFPDGLDAEIIKSNILFDLSNKELSDTDKEHVTYHIYTHPDEYKIGSITDSDDYSQYRLTVDEPIDLDLIDKVIGDIGIDPIEIEYPMIKELINSKDREYFINKTIVRNEGLKKSLDKERGTYE